MAYPRSHKFLHKWPTKSSNFFGCQGCHSRLCRLMDMPGLWRLKCIWSRTWKWASRQGHQQIWSSTNPEFLENSYSKVVPSISYFWMKLIIAAKQIEINNYFQPQDLEAFGSKNSVFKTEKDTNLVSRNIKKCYKSTVCWDTLLQYFFQLLCYLSQKVDRYDMLSCI